MNRMRSGMVAGLLVGMFAGELAAQEAGLGFHAGRVTDEGGNTRAGFTLAPALAWAEEDVAVRLFGQGTLFQQGGLLGVGGLEVRSEAAAVGPVSLNLGVEGAVAGSDAGYFALTGGLAPELRLAAKGWSVAAGPYLGSSGERVSERRTVRHPLLPMERAVEERTTHWRGVAGARAAVGGDHGPMAVRVGWTRLHSGEVSWEDWTVNGTLDLGVAALGAELGRRAGSLEERWASARAAVRVAEAVALVGEVGTYPLSPLTGRAGGEFASVGLSLRTGGHGGLRAPHRPAPVRRAGEATRLSLRAAPGAEVEVLGDWTEWEPVRVPEVRPGVYALEVALPAGVHRFAFRVNGDWRLPEGFEIQPNEFGSRHAVLRVAAK